MTWLVHSYIRFSQEEGICNNQGLGTVAGSQECVYIHTHAHTQDI